MVVHKLVFCFNDHYHKLKSSNMRLWFLLAALLNLSSGTIVLGLNLFVSLITPIHVGINLIEDVVFTIISQGNHLHANRASVKRDLWSSQLKTLTEVCIIRNIILRWQILNCDLYTLI